MHIERRNPALIIIFSLLTCGFYFLYWIYRVSDQMRFYSTNEGISPGVEILLCIFCAPYLIYWFYKYGKSVYEAQIRAGMTFPEDNSILYLILSIFGLGLIAACIMQLSLNRLDDYLDEIGE